MADDLTLMEEQRGAVSIRAGVAKLPELRTFVLAARKVVLVIPRLIVVAILWR